MSPELQQKNDRRRATTAEYGRALEKSRRTGKPMEIDIRGRPILPRWPLLTGVLPFLFSPGVPVRWLGLSHRTGLFASTRCFLSGLAMAMPAAALGAIAGMCIFAVGCVLTMICTRDRFEHHCCAIVSRKLRRQRAQFRTGRRMLDWFGDFCLVSPSRAW